MKPIAIFYHCLFTIDGKILPLAPQVVAEQMNVAQASGLLDAASQMIVGINGDPSLKPLQSLFPSKAQFIYHGEQCRNECRTIVALEEWLKSSPGFNVLYFHSKGATHGLNDPDHALRMRWRHCMMRNLVQNWRTCVTDLESGYEAVGCHWMTGDKTPPGQSIFAGNFWWASSDFLRTLPSIMVRDRIKESGIDAKISRYESEVWIGNGPRLPMVKDYHPAWIDQCVS